MRFPLSVCFALSALVPALCGAWMGVKPRPRPQTAASAPAGSATNPSQAGPKTSADTTLLYRRVLTIPANPGGRYLGTLEGVRCFNCAPDLVLLNLGDSVSSQAAVVALRIDAWNAVERPLKDRRMFDHDNKCFYFGFKDIDTAFVGGEWTEIRVQDVPCYPYVKRTLAVPVQEAPRPVSPPPAPPAPIATAPESDVLPEAAQTDPAAAPASHSAAPAPLPLPIDVVLEPTVD